MTQPFAQYSARLGDFIRRASAHPDGTAAPDHDAEFNQLALDLFALQFEHNRAYRKLCEARLRSPLATRLWSQIPAAPPSAFKELELTSLPEAERTTVFHSSGTSGQLASRHFHNRDSLEIYEESVQPWFQRHVLPERDGPDGVSPQPFQFISLTPCPSAAPHSSLVHMFQALHRGFGSSNSFFAGNHTSLGDWIIDPRELLEALGNARGSVVLLGTAFSIVHLLDYLAAASLQLPAGSRVLETGGYKGRSRSLPKAELHALITERLGIAPNYIVCEYGMSELSSQAYDIVVGSTRNPRLETRNFHFPPWARVQIISPETGREVAEGEAGLIRVIDLANVRSVLAVQTEDLAIRRGNRFELLGRAAVAEPRGCSLMTV